MKALPLSAELYQYILDMNPEENSFLAELRLKTDQLKYARLRSPTEQMHFISFLLHWLKPKKILELGTFTGYSTLAMALATSSVTTIITCDINNIFPDVGKDSWKAAGVDQRIQLRLGPALNTLAELKKEQHVFDFIYIDADKENSTLYFEQALTMLSQQGMIIVDNVLWKGKVVDPDSNESSTEAIRQFNQYLKKHTDVNYCLLPIGDGLSMVTKRCEHEISL